MKHKKYLSWDEYIQLIYDLGYYIWREEGVNALNFDGIFGIPRGGVFIASVLSYKYDVPLILKDEDITPRTLIVDDIADTGTTLEKYCDCGSVLATIHYAKGCRVTPDYYLRTNQGLWIVYPYEDKTSDTTPDYLKNDSSQT